jgi:hypothetical protein
MDDASPEVSLIDEIYVIRKQRNSDRLAAGFRPNPIYDDLICEIYDHCLSHLKKVWWDPNSGITTGKMFNFPDKLSLDETLMSYKSVPNHTGVTIR